MARKSPWQQFSDNFSSVYGSIKEAGQGIETAQAMAEEPVVQGTGLGAGPHSVYQASYGGQNYNEEITPEMLKGLRAQRMADIYSKYGQADKALDMEYKAEQIRELQSKNRVSEGTENALITRADLENADLTATTGARIAGTNYDVAKTTELYASLGPKLQKMFLEIKGLEINNRQEIVKANIAEATQDDVIAISGLNVTAKQLENKNKVLSNMNLKITNSGELIQLDIDKQTKDAKIQGAKLDLEAKEIENLNNTLKGTGMMYDNALGLINVETQEALQQSNIQAGLAENAAAMDAANEKSTAARLRNNANVVLLNYSEKVKNGDFKDGGGADWLRDNWTGDPEVKKVIDSMEDDELNGIMRDANIFMQEVTAAATGVRSKSEPALMALIDAQDGLTGNLQILDAPDGSFVRMVETDANGENPTVIAEGETWEMFTENLLTSVSPMTAVETAQKRANLAKTRAEADAITAEALRKKGIDWNVATESWSRVAESIVSTNPQITGVELDEQRRQFFEGLISGKQQLSQGGGIGGGGTNTNDAAYSVKQK